MTPLEKSIKHWEKNVAAEYPEEASVAWRDCALCLEYYYGDCVGCPIQAKTGESNCEGTPYNAADEALGSWIEYGDEFKPDFRAAAQQMLDFLKSLLPEEQPNVR